MIVVSVDPFSQISAGSHPSAAESATSSPSVAAAVASVTVVVVSVAATDVVAAAATCYSMISTGNGPRLRYAPPELPILKGLECA